jgi:uncharacterized membrane protein YfcA
MAPPPAEILGELLGLVVAIAAAGIVTGLLAGLFGIGGGAVIVPVLYEVFREIGVPEALRMQLCLGTSLAIIVPTVLRSYRAHRAREAVSTEALRAWAAPAVVGVAIGSVLAAFAPPILFKAGFAAIATLLAAKLLFGRQSWVLGSDLPSRSAMTAYGFAIGLGSSLMGIGGGSLATMVLTLYRVPIHRAVATAAGLGVPIALAGTIGYALAGIRYHGELPPLSVGFVSAIGVVMVAPVSSWVAPLGARLAHRLSRRSLEVGFGLFLLLAAARFVADALLR